jgi:hypothetical protein
LLTSRPARSLAARLAAVLSAKADSIVSTVCGDPGGELGNALANPALALPCAMDAPRIDLTHAVDGTVIPES